MGFCTNANTLSIASDVGYNLSGFNVFVAAVCVASIVFIFVQVFFSIKEDHFSLYLAFALLSSFTLIIAAIQRLLPTPTGNDEGASHGYQIFLDITLAVLISLQWIVHVGAVLFLFEKNPGKKYAPRRLLLISMAISAVLLLPWILALVLNKTFIGEIVDESILILFFVGSIVLSRQRNLARPMLIYW